MQTLHREAKRGTQGGYAQAGLPKLHALGGECVGFQMQ